MKDTLLGTLFTVTTTVTLVTMGYLLLTMLTEYYDADEYIQERVLEMDTSLSMNQPEEKSR